MGPSLYEEESYLSLADLKKYKTDFTGLGYDAT